MKQFVTILFFLVLIAPSYGSYQTPQFDLNALEFSNRAKCAVESEKPAKSAFLLVSNVTAAKAVYRLAKFRGEDVNEVTKRGITRFRFTVLSLINLIHERLNTRQLPLLPADVTREDQHVPSRYKNVMRQCDNEGYCQEFDDYLADIWEISSNNNYSAGTKYLELFKVDNYHSKDNYLVQKDYEKNSSRKMSCAYLKNFGPLQAHLYGTEPDAKAVDAIANAVENKNEMFAHCNDFDAQENLQVAAFELNVPHLRDRSLFKKRWLDKGFDYWHSMKVYLSYAFRNAPEVEEMAYPFGSLFKGVTLEESVMLVPNGCRSLAPKKCDGDRLALNTIREFAKEDFKENALELDVMSQVPGGPDEDLVDDPIPSVNVDELDLSAHDSASKWLENFSGNLSSARVSMKKRLTKAINHFNFVSKAMSVDDLLNKVDQQFGGLLFSGKNPELTSQQKNQLYYLCSEFSFSQHEQWSFIRKDLDLLENSKAVDHLTSQISLVSTQESHKYFTSLGDALNDACYSLKQKEIWDDEFELDKEGFMPWYTEKVYDGKVESLHDDNINSFLQNNKPLLSFPQYDETGQSEDVICAHASDCARKTIKSILAIYSATQYASTFWSLEQKVKTPDLFNPYAERNSCEVYDPWFKTRSTVFNFLWNMGQATASAFVPGMIYTNAQLSPKTVTSFKQMIKDGKLEYDVQYSEEKIISSLTADFGALTGVPCAVSLNRNANNPLSSPFRFTGISVGACSSDQDYNLNVSGASDIGENRGQGSSQCLSCSINFESVSGVLAHTTQNVGPAFFLVRGIYNLYKSLKDPFNIPRSWSVHPYDAYETKAFYGEIPRSCVDRLTDGKPCLDACGKKVSQELREKMFGHITDFDVNSFGWGEVEHSLCNEKIRVKTYESQNQNDQFDDHSKSCQLSEVVIPESCREFLK